MKKYIFYLIAPTMLLLTYCSSENSDWKNAKAQNNVQAFEQFINDYPRSTFKDSASLKMVTIVIKGTLIKKNNVNPIVSSMVYLCEVGPNGEVNGNFSDMPQGKTDELGNFSLTVNRKILSKMKCFVFILLDGGSVIFSDKIGLENITSEAMVIDIGKAMIEN